MSSRGRVMPARAALAQFCQRQAQSLMASFGVLRRWRPSLKDVAEIALVCSALPFYYLARGVTHTQVDEAVQRGVDIVQLEQSLGIFWEVELQSWALSYDWLVNSSTTSTCSATCPSSPHWLSGCTSGTGPSTY